MPRHRVRRHTGVIVAGVVAAGTGLALLVVPVSPIAARTGSVLGPAPAAPTVVAPGPQDTAPTASLPERSGPPSGSAAPAAPGVVVAGPEEPPRPLPAPVPVLDGFVPDRLVVEALAVDAPLVTTRVDGVGALVPPDDPDRLGWWRGVRPGTGAGSVVVAGHVDSTRFGQGPLARLVDLVPGDRAVLSGPDGARSDYVVRGVETFPKESFPAAELFGTDGAERLVLVTCGGAFDRRSGSWDSNVVAVLDPVPPA